LEGSVKLEGKGCEKHYYERNSLRISWAEHRTFKEAAQSLSVSPPCFTRCIKDADQKLGLNLFIMSPLPVSLNPDYEHVFQLFKEIDQAYVKLNQLSK